MSPTLTAAASAGVYPANQAEVYPLLVPVLPAAGRPIDWPRMVPLVKTPESTWFTASATSGSSAVEQLGGISVRVPSRSTIAVIAIGRQYRPRAANVAKAAAIVVGSISFTPRVKVGTSRSGAPSARR